MTEKTRDIVCRGTLLIVLVVLCAVCMNASLFHPMTSVRVVGGAVGALSAAGISYYGLLLVSRLRG